MIPSSHEATAEGATAPAETSRDEAISALGTAFEVAPIGMAMISARPAELGRFLQVNAAACRLTGLTEPELLAADITQLTFPDDRERDLDLLRSLLDGEVDRVRIEKRIVRGDGSPLWVQVDRSLVRDEDDEPLYLVAQIQDISERRRRAQQLQCERAFGRILAQSITAEGAMSAVLPALAETLDCEVAIAWQLDESAGGLRCDSSWRADEAAAATNALSREITLKPGAGLPGRVWETGHAAASADLPGDPSCPRASAAEADGLLAGGAFPLVAGRRTIGVVELLSTQPAELDEALLATLEEGGRQLGSFVARKQLEEQSQGPAELLLVEDDPFIASLVERMLSDSDATLGLHHAGSLAAARDRILAAPPACVLLDLTLPDATGLQGLLEIRKLAPGVPVVVLTGHEDADLAVRAVQEGAQDYLIKRKSDMEALGRSVRYAIERKRSERRAFEDLLHDPVTGLPNRVLLTDRVRVALTRARGGLDGGGDSGHVAVLHLDLNRFRLINDSLGHKTGDAILAEVGKRLRDEAGAETTVAALGADKFAILAEGFAGPRDAVDLAERLLEGLRQPVRVGDERLSLDASIGIAVANGDGRDAEALLHDADIARARAKESGSSYEIFDEQVRAGIRERLDLETELRDAFDREQFRLLYQPIVSLAEGQVVAMEALIRWQHPERGLVPPADFLPIAEESGLIVPIGEWILAEACQELTRWQRLDRLLRVSVNLSPTQVHDPGLPDAVAGAVAAAEIKPGQLWLEITETALIEGFGSPLETLRALHELGVTLTLDDFGTGYSSLGYLRRFPIEALKVDRSLVTGLADDRQLTEIVSAVVTMGAALGMPVIAEGVETDEDVARLRELGCRLAQGYRFAHPLPADEAREFLLGSGDNAGLIG